MNDTLFNKNIYKLAELWKKNGEYSYISILNHLLEEHTKKICFPDGDRFIYFPKKEYSEQAIITVMDSLEIKYSLSTIPANIAISFD